MNPTHESKSSQTNSKIFLGGTLTTIADMLMGRAIKLPDGRVLNPASIARDQRYRDGNPDYARQKQARYREKHSETISARRKERMATDPEFAARERERRARWNRENREACTAGKAKERAKKAAPGVSRSYRFYRRWAAAKDPAAYLTRLSVGDIDQRRAARWIRHGKP